MSIAALLILPKKLMIYRENPQKIPVWEKSMNNCYSVLYIVQWCAGILGVQPLDQRDVAENLFLHEGMVFDHLHTSYAKLLNRNLNSTQSS
jgi:hypothetical protein